MNNKIAYILLLPLLSSVVFAADFNVKTTQEFRVALANSAGNGESDTITLAAGTYKTTDDGLGTFVFLDNEDFDLTIEGVDSDRSILSGDDQNRVLSFNVVGSTAEIVFEKVSVLNGLTTTYGGGVYSKENFTCKNCIFRNNEAARGGGLYVERENDAIIENSSFTDNMATYGGAIEFGYLVNPVIRNSTFISNQAEGGGAIYLSSSYGTEIKNSMFRANSASRGGAIFQSFNGATVIKSSIFADNIGSYGAAALSFASSSYQRLLIANSIFYGNLVNDPDDEVKEAIHILGRYGYIEIVNTAIINNSGGIRFSGDDEHTFISNTVFSNNSYSDVTIEDSTIPQIMNSFVPSITGTAFTESILTEGDLGFLDIANNDFHLSSNSVLIDSGVNIFTMGDSGWEQPNEVDIDSNQRLSGGSMDIGPYEFSSTRPTITKFDVEGVRKVDQVLLFVTDATASSGRTITSYEIDNGSGAFVSASSEFGVTYSTSGQRLVRVKVTDDQGEWSAKSLTISIADLTLDEKILAATEAGRQQVINDPSSYGLYSQASLDEQILAAREAGRQDVITSPSTYGLTLASEIPAAREEQIAACLASPSSCGIDIPNADIDGDGTVDALSDGLLILRYLFGLEGETLVSGVVSDEATRTTEEIEAYLHMLMP